MSWQVEQQEEREHYEGYTRRDRDVPAHIRARMDTDREAEWRESDQAHEAKIEAARLPGELRQTTLTRLHREKQDRVDRAFRIKAERIAKRKRR